MEVVPQEPITRRRGLAAHGAMALAGRLVGVGKVLRLHSRRRPSVLTSHHRTRNARSRATVLNFRSRYIVSPYNDLFLWQVGGGGRGSIRNPISTISASIRGLWSSLCESDRQAIRCRGPASAAQERKRQNYLIGFSFTAEMGLRWPTRAHRPPLRVDGGADERGGRRIPTSRYCKAYAAFSIGRHGSLPVRGKAAQFARPPLVPLDPGRRRRGSLSLQYCGPIRLCKLMRFVAGYDPADSHHRRVVGAWRRRPCENARPVKVPAK